jgi:hypothetical protein
MDKAKVAAHNNRKRIYGLIQEGKLTMREIGQKCGVSRQRVSQVGKTGERVDASPGRPRRYIPCPFCPSKFPSHDLIMHIAVCASNPDRRRK